jgi:hypothetical protein
MSEHSSKSVVLRGATLKRVNNSLVTIRSRLCENSVTNSGQHDFAETMRGGNQGTQDGECAERESNGVNNWLVWQVLKKPRWKLHIGFGVVWLVLFSMSEKIKSDGITPNINEQGINSWLLPGFSEAAAPTMD